MVPGICLPDTLFSSFASQHYLQYRPLCAPIKEFFRPLVAPNLSFWKRVILINFSGIFPTFPLWNPRVLSPLNPP